MITGAADPADVEAYVADASRVDHVAEVVTAHGTWADGQRVGDPAADSARYAADAGEWFEVVPSVPPMSPRGRGPRHDLRALDPPFDALVGGSTAQLVDTKDGDLLRRSVGRRCGSPWRRSSCCS